MTDNKEMNDWFRSKQDEIDSYLRMNAMPYPLPYDAMFKPPSTMNWGFGNSKRNFPRNLINSLYSNKTLKYKNWMWLKDGTIKFNSYRLNNSYLNNITMRNYGQVGRIDMNVDEIIDCDFRLSRTRYIRLELNDLSNSKFKLNANDKDYANRLNNNSIVGCEFRDSILRGLRLERNTISSSQFIDNSFLDSYVHGNLIMDSSFESIKFWRMNMKLRGSFGTRETSVEQLDNIIKNPHFLNCSFKKVNFKNSNWSGLTSHDAKTTIGRYNPVAIDLFDDNNYQSIFIRFDGCDFDEVKMQNMAELNYVQFSNCTFNKLKLSPYYSRSYFSDIDMKNTTFTKCDLTGSRFSYSGDYTSRKMLKRYRFFSRNNRHPRLEEWKNEIEENKYDFPRTIEECTFNNCSFKNYSMETTFNNAMFRDVEFNFKRARGFSNPADESFLHFSKCSLMDVRFEDSEIGSLKFDNCVVALSFKNSKIQGLYLTHDTTLEFGRRVSNFENAVVKVGKIDGLFERYNFTNATFGTELQGVDFSNSDITPEKLESVGATFTERCIFPTEEAIEEEGDTEDNESLGNESLSGIFSEQELEEMANDSDFGWDDEGMGRWLRNL
jgi:uncharacterized protein YjbI with pentapeptide repeats